MPPARTAHHSSAARSQGRTDGTTWTRQTSRLSSLTPLASRWSRGTTWTRRAVGTVAGVVGAFALAGAAPALAAPASAKTTGPVHTYVVRAVPGRLAALKVDLDGRGTVIRQIGLIQAEVVRLHASDVARLRGSRDIASITLDSSVELDSARGQSQTATATLSSVADAIGATSLYAKGITGKGVDVALIDSGITPVDGLASTSIVNGADLSFESQRDSTRYVDGFGHGTHMAGIIAGNGNGFRGIAPDARLVNVKVADSTGAADVSQVIAGLDWVVQHAHSDGLDIRVVNLSFGTDSQQDYRIDPLAYAAEQAWHAGIVVVVSAGNNGWKAGSLADPADDPYVLAVGSADTTTRRISVSSFSQRGDGVRNPDLVAPGAHIASLRDPGSTIDQAYGATATTPDGLFKGSGTSQAAAVTTGAVALLLSARPNLTPDEVKAALTSSADDLGYGTRSQGNGLIDLVGALNAQVDGATQSFDTSNGSGSLEAARGSDHVQVHGIVLRGEQDVNGAAWSAGGYTGQGWAGQGWGASSWAGQGWASQGWQGQGWQGQGWQGQGWAGQTWA